MDISGVLIPAVPDVQQAPPRDAQLQTAVSEASQSDASQNNPQADTGAGTNRDDSPRDESSNVGRNIDARV